MATPYFPLYPKDFLGATGRLNAEKFGVYSRLLFTSWFEPLNNDIEELAFLVGSSEEITKQILERYFVLHGEIWTNPRLEKERIIANKKHNKAVESGKKGAEIRWGGDSNPNSPPISNPISNPNSRGDSKTIATQNSELRTHNAEEISHNSVLRAHNAFNSISTKKASNHEIMQITQLCHDNSLESVLTAIDVMGDHSWHSIRTLKKVLSGELPKTDEETTIQYDPEAMV